jgi:hypothetical protein
MYLLNEVTLRRPRLVEWGCDRRDVPAPWRVVEADSAWKRFWAALLQALSTWPT